MTPFVSDRSPSSSETRSNRRSQLTENIGLIRLCFSMKRRRFTSFWMCWPTFTSVGDALNYFFVSASNVIPKVKGLLEWRAAVVLAASVISKSKRVRLYFNSWSRRVKPLNNSS